MRPHDHVLVFPCGDGSLCREIAAQVPLGVVVGLDTSDDNVRAARAACRDLDNVMVVRCENGEIPWKGGFFSQAIVDGEGLPASEIQRVLADGRQAFRDRV